MLEGLNAAFDRAVADDEVKVVVVAGAGERAFSAGYDLGAEAAHADIPAHEWHGVLATDIDATMRLWSLPKPTIAAVRGYCLAGGCELAMACDIIVSGESGRFGEPEIRYGSGPVTLLMPFILGQKKTNELLFTGDMIDAEAAERAGMINRVVADERARGRRRGAGPQDRADAAAGAAADEDRARPGLRGHGFARSCQYEPGSLLHAERGRHARAAGVHGDRPSAGPEGGPRLA